ncbi:tripartite tricarboxylate transporter substrate binding protein [Chelativorans sp. M5D2P16]|uniref:Bug family tripartite tricarboxylate transporter substrate binding protein n=1 Tax=Chelativorans sp. M5D2P16 TaxID=3095678 RepID=UPI002ACAA47B|nr:tripartite tricarboxylate transporter substrate binding protein [Chelativorans sp. M5D2P16]MDZ5698309.1 tripartite tricarboxylate transporter substrate binding protein [Chelativorans sp. M5D2P16]
MLNRLRRGIGAAMVVGASVAAGTLAMGSPARADYPEKPVEMTVLFGGTANTIAQLLTELMSEELGNPVVPVSRPGGGGAIGYAHVQSTRPDGYNIVWNSNSINTAHHLGNLPFGYDAFTPIARVSVEVPVLAVNKDKNWENLDDMVAAVKESGKPINVGISGKGSFTHLTSVALFDAMGIADKVNYISYGDGKAPVELLAGRIDAAIQWPGQFVSYVESGDVVVLASTGSEKVEVIPGLKTAQEQGYDIDIAMWRGLAAPTGTPPAVVEKLEAAAQAAVKTEAFQKASQTIGFKPAFLGNEEFGELIAHDDAFYADLLEKLGMTK